MLEFHLNNKHKLRTFLGTFIHKYDCNRLHINIYPNTIGPGIRFYHRGSFSGISKKCTIGKNCTFLIGSVIGNKGIYLDEKGPQIGDNCYIGLNCFISGNIKIGNNVTIGANSVVTKDIPDNAIVAGCPAKVLKMKI